MRIRSGSLRGTVAAATLSCLAAASPVLSGPVAAADQGQVVGGASSPAAESAASLSLGGDPHPYVGPLPDPMPLSPAPVHDPADLSAFQDEASMSHARDLAAITSAIRQGGRAAVAAWMTLLVATGTPVLDESGAPISLDGSTGTGLAVSPSELRLIGSLGATPGGLTLAELGEVLEGVPGMDGSGVAQALLPALQGFGMISEDPTAEAFFNAFYALSFEPFRTQPSNDPAEIRLSWAQVALLLHRLAGEAVSRAAQAGGPSIGSRDLSPRSGVARAPRVASRRQVGLLSAAAPRIAAAGPCGIENETVRLVVDSAQKYIGTIFGQYSDRFFEKAETEVLATGVTGAQLPPALAKTQKLLKAIGLAQTIGGFLAIAAKAAALSATFELDAPPLVRTKSQHPGEVKDVRVSMQVDLGLYQEIVTCINLALRTSGVQVPMVETGKASGIPMDLFSEDPILKIGDGIPGGASDTKRTTDAEGMTTFKVSGAAQAQKIPEGAARKPVTVLLRAVAALEANDLKKDLIDLPGDALAPISGVIQKLASRVKWLTFYGAVPVVDWDLKAVFDVTLTADQRDHQALAQNVIVDPPCQGGRQSISSDQEFTARSETVRVDAVLLDNPQGNWGDQVVVFVPHGQPFMPYGSLTGDPYSSVKLFALPTTIEVKRQEHKPGLAPLPEFKDLQSVCAGGDCGRAGCAQLPKPDCGLRKYTLDMSIVVPQPRRLYPFPQDFPGDFLFESCITMDDTPGAFVSLANAGSSIKVKGGQFPAIEEVFDPSVGQIDILGSATYHVSEPGYLVDQHFKWTLTLCRVVDEQPAC